MLVKLLTWLIGINIHWSLAIPLNNITLQNYADNCAWTNMSWLRLHRNLLCIRFLSENIPECIHEALFDAHIKIWHQQFDSYIGRNVMRETHKSDCETFLMLDNQNVSALWHPHHDRGKRFFPFTRIFVLNIHNGAVSSDDMASHFDDNQLYEIHRFALEVYFVTGHYNLDNGSLIFTELKNVLTQKLLKLSKAIQTSDLSEFYGTHLEHPMVNVRNETKTFVMSYFNCSPNVIYFDDANDKRYEHSLHMLDVISMA